MVGGGEREERVRNGVERHCVVSTHSFQADSCTHALTHIQLSPPSTPFPTLFPSWSSGTELTTGNGSVNPFVFV